MAVSDWRIIHYKVQRASFDSTKYHNVLKSCQCECKEGLVLPLLIRCKWQTALWRDGGSNLKTPIQNRRPTDSEGQILKNVIVTLPHSLWTSKGSHLVSTWKLSADLTGNSDSGKPKVYIHNPNTHDNSFKGDCYQTLDYLKHHRKTCSEASFTQHHQEGSREGAISQSADTTPSHVSTLQIPLTDSTSQSSSLNIRLSSSNASSKSNYQEDGEVDLPQKRPAVSLTLTDAFLEHDYYNIMHINDRSEDSLLKYPFTANGDSNYYNLAWSLSPADNLHRLKFQRPSLVTSGDSLQYVKLDFQDKIYSQISKKASATVNYTEISIHHTEVLKDLDDNMKDFLAAKKKRPSFLKSFFKK